MVVSFGGPEGMADVMPFLERVTRGRNTPRERLEEVAHHYEQFGGVSPINSQNRALIAALERELDAHAIKLPIYLGNRNWHPFLTDTIRGMRDDGIRRVLAFVTSAFSCHSGCRQYREDIAKACAEAGTNAPQVDKLRLFHDHPGFIEPMADALGQAVSRLSPDRRAAARVIFTAHSIPLAMARASAYEKQLGETGRLVAERAGVGRFELVYQSRSGPPHVPWLEPDVLDYLNAAAREGTRDVVALPVGFISDHMEVLFDLDIEAAEKARELGIGWHRVPTVGTAPDFVAMIRELIQERMEPKRERRALGRFGPSPDVCPANCCVA